MKKKNIIKIIALLGLVVLLISPSISAWSINPAKWPLYHKKDYEIEPYEWPMEIENDADTPITVSLTIIEPKYLYEGHTALPNLEWVTIETAELIIPPKGKKTTMIHIDIQNTTEAYNQSFEFWIFADQTEGAGNIQTDYNCRWMVITPERFVPMNERAGYVDWGMIYIIFAALAGVAAVMIILFKKVIFNKKPKSEDKPISMRAQKTNPIKPVPQPVTQQAPKKSNDNVIKIKRNK